jgi:hypothetical protein
VEIRTSPGLTDVGFDQTVLSEFRSRLVAGHAEQRLLDLLLPRTLSKTLPAITPLRTLWEQQFEAWEQGGQWRQEPALPAAQLIPSPYDLDARNGKKRSTFWTGYKVHFTKVLR